MKLIPNLAIAYLGCITSWAAAPPDTTLKRHGWAITMDADHGSLTIQHERLGTLLREVRLNVDTAGSLAQLNRMSVQASGPGRLVVRTGQPATLWAFDTTTNGLMISSTAPGAVLTAQAPVSSVRRMARLLDPEGIPVTWQGTSEVVGSYGGSMTRNPSFLPRENPDCMYFALGRVAGTVFHSLFDQSTDTGITFPEQTRFEAGQPGADSLGITMPLPGPGLVRLIPDYYTRVLGVPYYLPFDDSTFNRSVLPSQSCRSGVDRF